MTRDDRAAARASGADAASDPGPVPRRPRRVWIKRRWGVHVVSVGRRILIVEENETVGRRPVDGVPVRDVAARW